MRICCCSDLHGFLPEIPDCNLLLLAGDYTFSRKGDILEELKFYHSKFIPWLRRIRDRGITTVAVAGNHCFILQDGKYLLPEMPWIYLEDSGYNFDGLKIWGSPYQPVFCNWAFNLPEEKLKEKWDLIPIDTNILLLHGPPYGVADLLANGDKHSGSSRTLTEKIQELSHFKNLKLIVCGHFHFNYGFHTIYRIPLINASHCDESYKPVNKPIIVEI